MTCGYRMCGSRECLDCYPAQAAAITDKPKTERRVTAPEVMNAKPPAQLTGGSSDYYKVKVQKPTTPFKLPYEAECNDIIESLDMRFAEANIFKAIWRRAAARLDKGKPGTTSKYDAEKMVFFSERELAKETS